MERDERILRAAEILFFERGFKAVSISDIGKAAGITGPGVYRYFETKAEILATLFDRAVEELMGLALTVEPGADDELERLVLGHAEYVVAHYRLAAVRAREDLSLAEPYRRRYDRREAAYLDRWVEVLARMHPGRPRADLVASAIAVMNLLNTVGLMPGVVRREADLAPLLSASAQGALATLGQTAGTPV